MPEKKGYKINTGKIDVLILCGGEGRRLRRVIDDLPKPMADINGQPFLDILIDYAAGFGFRRFILCVGYKGDIIKRHYKKRKDHLKILFSQEEKPLGTAGALKNAEMFIKSNFFLVMNGDSLCKVDLNKFIEFYIRKKALFSVILAKAKTTMDYGLVRLGDSQQILQFDEKAKVNAKGLVNAGIYILEKSILDMIPTKKTYSLEYDLFPKIINNRFYGYIAKEELIDIGTPERYKEARQAFN